jgi:hypothetical protein
MAGSLVVVVVLASQMLAGAEPARAPRRVLGTVETIGDVSLRDSVSASTAELLSDPRTALVDGNVVETGAKSGAVLSLQREGMIGLRASSLARGLSGPRVELLGGSALVRLPATSRLVVSTPSGTIRTDTSALEPTGATHAEGTVSVLPAGKTLVRVERGALYVQGRGGDATLVRACEQVILSPTAAPRLIAERTVRPRQIQEAPVHRTCQNGGMS